MNSFWLNSPWFGIICLSLGALCYWWAGKLKVQARGVPWIVRKAKIEARGTSLSRWYVRVVTFKNDSVELELVLSDLSRQPLTLKFNTSHPSVSQLKVLKRLDLIGFTFSAEPVEGMEKNESDPSAYLRLKEA